MCARNSLGFCFGDLFFPWRRQWRSTSRRSFRMRGLSPCRGFCYASSDWGITISRLLRCDELLGHGMAGHALWQVHMAQMSRSRGVRLLLCMKLLGNYNLQSRVLHQTSGDSNFWASVLCEATGEVQFARSCFASGYREFKRIS